MRSNFLALFSRLGKTQREAERELEIDSLTNRIRQVKKLFLKSLTSATTRGEVAVFLERVEALVDKTIEGANVIRDIRKIHREFNLDEPNQPIEDLDSLKDRIGTLQYIEIIESQSDD